MSDTAAVPTEVTETNPMLREINRGLMTMWINADLLNRAQHDVRRSIVFYDEDKAFLWAFAADSDVLSEQSALDVLYKAGARTYSRGIV